MPQDKLEALLANRARIPFKEGLRPVESVSPETTEAIKTLRRYSPTSIKVMEDGVNIAEGGLGNKFLNLLSNLQNKLKGESAYDTSFAGQGTVYLHPNDIGNVDTLAHELGHERQRQIGLPVRNDKAADYLVNEGFTNKKRLDAIFDPEPLASRNGRRPKFGQSTIKVFNFTPPSQIEVMSRLMSDPEFFKNSTYSDDDEFYRMISKKPQK